MEPGASTLIIGNSGGIGRALHEASVANGQQVTGLSRSGDGIDFADPAAVEQKLAALEGPFERIIVATGALAPEGGRPETSLRQLTAESLHQQFAVNTIGPALVMKQIGRLLPRDRRAVFAVLSARVGSIGDNRLGGWYAYRASKTALNQLLHSAAIEISRTHKQSILVALHPGTVATSFTASYKNRYEMQSASDVAQQLLGLMDSFSLADTGGFFDWRGDPVPW